jgi:hypothetical protein
MNTNQIQQSYRMGIQNTTRIVILFFILTGFWACRPTDRSPSDSDAGLRFAVASDGHYGQGDTRYEEDYDRLIDHLNRESEYPGLDYVFLVGDLFHDDPKFLGPVKKKLDGLRVPYFAIRGNHDMASDREWEQTWGYPDNHIFEVSDYGFILASTSDSTGEYLCADVDWLVEQLEKFHDKKGIFVFMHITPNDWTGAGIDCPGVRNALESHDNVVAVFQGHDHNEDGLKVWNRVPYYFDGHFGGSFGTPYPGYRIVELDPNGIMHTYQYNMEMDPVSNRTTQHLAFMSPGQFIYPPSDQYHPGSFAMTDGTCGSYLYNDGSWIGVEGEDLVYTLDLGKVLNISGIRTDFLVNMSAWIFAPLAVRYEISTDGQSFEEIYLEEQNEPHKMMPISRQTFEVLIERPARFIRIEAASQGTCPEWHDGSGGKAWIFTDEIEIY